MAAGQSRAHQVSSRYARRKAIIIRRIFAENLAGDSARTIAGRLNEVGVHPPRGRFWTAITIAGNSKCGHGLLLNPPYAGKRVWNRVRMPAAIRLRTRQAVFAEGAVHTRPFQPPSCQGTRIVTCCDGSFLDPAIIHAPPDR